MDNSRLTLERQQMNGDTARFRLDGELDMADADRVRDALADALRRCRSVVVDLSCLDFIDSSGFRALHEAHLAADDSGSELVFVSPQEAVSRVVRMIGFDHLRFTDDRSLLHEPPASPAAEVDQG